MQPDVTAFRDEVEKIAATRYMKEMRRLANEGNLRAVENMARRLSGGSGVNTPSALGKPIKDLGSGAEGMATLTFGAKDAPRAGLSARKMHDPEGTLFIPEMIAKKVEVGKQLRGDPLFARMYSDKVRHAGKSPYYHGEYVPGVEIHKAAPTSLLGDPAYQRMAQEAGEGVLAAEKRLKGNIRLEDVVHMGRDGGRFWKAHNTMVTPGGQVKVIDVVPTERALAERATRIWGRGSPGYWDALGAPRTPGPGQKWKDVKIPGMKKRLQEAIRQQGGAQRVAPKVRGAKAAPGEGAYVSDLRARLGVLPETASLSRGPHGSVREYQGLTRDALRQRAAQQTNRAPWGTPGEAGAGAGAGAASPGRMRAAWSALVDFIRTAPGRAVRAIQRVFGLTPEQARNFAATVAYP